MTPLLSDARLADQATAGDRRAFATIFRRHHQGLYRFCLSILGRPEDAQEALQNTMVKALHALPGEKREVKLKPWLYRVAHNESVDLLRRRREGVALEDQQLDGGIDIAQTAATRERLSRLLADLTELPERQRSALVMRELSGLDYGQIGEAFETSDAVARQTVYEARVALRELEAGREMDCKLVAKQLSDADGRTARRRDIRAHLRACPDCRALRDSIDSRQRDLAMLAPLPAAAAMSVLHSIVGGGTTAGGLGGGGAGAVAAGASKVAATPVTLKAVATVAVAATIGVTAADRGGLINAVLPGSGHAAKTQGVVPTGKPGGPPEIGGQTASHGSTGAAAEILGSRASIQGRRSVSEGPAQPRGPGASAATSTPGATSNHGNQGEAAAGGPAETRKAKQHRQQTARHQGRGHAHSPGKPHAAPAHQAPPGQGRESHVRGNGKGKSGTHAPAKSKAGETVTGPPNAAAEPVEPAAERPESQINAKDQSKGSEASP